MHIAVHQADFLPWSGFWTRFLMVDRLVLIGGVEYSSGDVTNRVKLDGSWMTLPMSLPEDRMHTGIKFDRRALKKISKTIRQKLMNKSVPYGSRLEPVVQVLDSWETDSLFDLNVELIRTIAKMLGHQADVVVDHKPMIGETKTERLHEMILRHVKPGTCPIWYVSGMGGRDYLQPMPDVIPTFVRCFHPDETVLQLIASRQYPRDQLRQSYSLSY